MAIVKPRPQSEVLEEELEKPSLPPKKVINYKEIAYTYNSAASMTSSASVTSTASTASEALFHQRTS
jgi:hypothetical protein